MVLLGELLMILDLHRQGLSVTAIARRTGRDPKTVRKYIERGLEPPAYGPRQAGRPSKLAPYLVYLRERVAAFPDLSAVRLTREQRERGYTGAYTAVKRFVAATRPPKAKPYEVQDELDPDALVFLDETATTTNMVRHYGWAPRGERCRVAAPHGHVWTPPRVQAKSRDGRGA